ncbi:MAG: hypothetical protein ACWA5X_10095 [bacterium]
MPYFVFKIGESVSALVKNFEVVDKFDSYKEAKKVVKELRPDLEPGTSAKIIFADNALAAEEMLGEQRDKPVLAEWEK